MSGPWLGDQYTVDEWGATVEISVRDWAHDLHLMAFSNPAEQLERCFTPRLRFSSDNCSKEPTIAAGLKMFNFLPYPSETSLKVFDEAGDFCVTDLEHGRIFRVDRDGEWSLVTEYDGEPNGLKWRAPGGAAGRRLPQRLGVASRIGYGSSVVQLSLSGGTPVIVMVNSYPLPVRPSVAAPDRSAVWLWLAPLLKDGTVEFFYPKPGRGAVAVFRVDSAETLQGHLTEWGERVPCTFEVTLLVDPDHQKRMVGHPAD